MMDEKQVEELAKLIAEKMREHPKCNMFSEDDVRGIKEMAQLFKSGKSACVKIIITLIYLAVGFLLLVGVKNWIKDFLGR